MKEPLAWKKERLAAPDEKWRRAVCRLSTVDAERASLSPAPAGAVLGLEEALSMLRFEPPLGASFAEEALLRGGMGRARSGGFNWGRQGEAEERVEVAANNYTRMVFWGNCPVRAREEGRLRMLEMPGGVGRRGRAMRGERACARGEEKKWAHERKAPQRIRGRGRGN